MIRICISNYRQLNNMAVNTLFFKGFIQLSQYTINLFTGSAWEIIHFSFMSIIRCSVIFYKNDLFFFIMQLLFEPFNKPVQYNIRAVFVEQIHSVYYFKPTVCKKAVKTLAIRIIEPCRVSKIMLISIF